MTTSDACAARVQREHAELEAAITAALPAPENHRWITTPDEFTWWANDPLGSVSNGCHLYLRPTGSMCEDPEQLRIELRWFWRSGPDTPAAYGAKMMRETDRERAILWCEVGPNIVRRYRSLLPESAAHLSADGIPALAEAAIAYLRPAMARWQEERARAPSVAA